MPPEDLVERIARRLANHQPTQVVDPRAARAAVAVVISRTQSPAVLLVRRKVRSGDPWSGHMAFPGGYNSTHDASLVVTAMRETLEETGIDLVTTGRLAGELSDVAPRSPLLPPVVVRPFVFIVDRQGETTPSDEIDEAPWFTIADLFDAANQQPFSLDFPGGSRTFDSIQLRGYTIWGLTERILHQFRGIVGL